MITASHKKANLKWDRENMKSFSCRLRKEDADVFKEYCQSRNTTPGAVLKKYVTELIDQYCDELDMLHNDNSDTPISDETE